MSRCDVNVNLYFFRPSAMQANYYDYDQDDYEPDYTEWEEEDYEVDVEYDDGLYEYYYDPFPEYDHYPYGCYDAPAFPQPFPRHELA